MHAALAGQPWALTGTLYLEGVLDDEGRPVGERRETSAVKDGVEIELRACPYRDARHGLQMNVSALRQITRHLDDTLASIDAFHGARGRPPESWRDVLSAVIDQLGRPGRAVLAAGAAHRVPAQDAVGHKLAAGFFGVIHQIVRDEALGHHRPLTADALVEAAVTQGALIGASEVCAGPMHLIKKASEALVSGAQTPGVAADPARVVVADAIVGQLRHAMAWAWLDARVEQWTLRDGPLASALTPVNDFMRRRLHERLAELPDAPPHTTSAEAILRDAGEHGARCVAAMRAIEEDCPPDADLTALRARIDQQRGALRLSDEAQRERVARALCHYLAAMAELLDAQVAHERAARAALGLSTTPALAISSILLPSTQGLFWLERFTDLRWSRSPAPLDALALSGPGCAISWPR